LRHLAWLAVPLTATVASTALAGGYFSGEKGARVAGRAGAVTAKADDVMAVHYNPAGLSDVGTTLIQVGNRFSYNAYSFTRKPTLDWCNTENCVPPYVTFDEVENDTPWQVLDPLVGVATNFGLKDWGFAFAAYAPAGIAHQRYPEDGGQRYMMVEREATILNYSLSAAWQYRNMFGVGASLQWIAVPNLSYSLVVEGHGMGNAAAYPVSSPYDLRATVEGKDLFTPNAILGAWYKPAKFLEIGVSGQVIPASIETDSKLDLDPLSTGITEDVVLTRDGKEADDVSLSLPLPLTARLGVRYIHLHEDTELFDIELDVSYETWSRVESFKVNSDGLVANLLLQQVDVGNIEVEKEWNDTITVQLGGDYVAVPNLLTVRGGVFFESAVADDAYANVDFVGGEQLGAALGGSFFVQRFEIAVAYGFRFQPSFSVSEKESEVSQETPASLCGPPYTGENCHPAYLGRSGPAANAGTYRAHSHVASLDVLYRF
jgi:long-chain fatty acid transport protein